MLIRVLYSGLPRDDNPLLWALARGVAHATDVFLSQPKYVYLSHHFKDRRMPSASRLSYLLSAKGDRTLTALEEDLRMNIPGVDIVVYMFDGMEVIIPAGKGDVLAERLRVFGAAHDVTLVLKIHELQ